MDAEQKRERIIRFRVNEEEYNAIAKAAKESGFDSMSDYIRTIAIDRCIFIIDKAELAKLRRAFSAISNNINQIAIRVNSTGTVYADDLVEIKEGVKKAWQHLHCHIVFNNTNLENGKTFETLENQKSVDSYSWEKLRDLSDKLCREHGLSVVENPEQGKGKSWYEWQQDRAGLSWKTKLKFELDNCIMASTDFEDFLRQCAERNIEAVYNPDNKINLKFRMQGQEKFTRARTLGWYYEVPQIKRRIQNFQLLKTGQLANQPRTKIIDTSQDKFQAAKGLERWADIQNMKEASRVLSILTSHQIGSQKELESTAITEQSRRMKIVSDLNQMQKEIDVLSDRIKLVHLCFFRHNFR